MNKNYLVLQNCRLFSGISGSKQEALLRCLAAREKQYKKNGIVFLTGDNITFIGIVLKGAVHIVHEDYWGRRKIAARIESGEIFGEAFACAETKKLPVSIIAAEKTELLLLDSRRITKPCSAACSFHADLVRNLTILLAEKNIALIQKLEHITQTNTREKLLSYLSEQANKTEKNAFEILFNREELADYLSVERSAMSAELSRMKKDGLIVYRKNHFELIKAGFSEI